MSDNIISRNFFKHVPPCTEFLIYCPPEDVSVSIGVMSNRCVMHKQLQTQYKSKCLFYKRACFVQTLMLKACHEQLISYILENTEIY